MISVNEIENLAKLARVKLDEKDKESLVNEFDSILDYIDRLKEVSVSMDAESRLGITKNVMRPDVARDSHTDLRERLLKSAPHREGDFVAVKKIIAQS